MLEKTFQIADAIVALVRGDISKEELDMLDNWVNESEDNRKLFLTLMDEQLFLERQKALVTDTPLKFEDVLKPKKRILMWKVLSVVALVVVMVGVVFLWRNSDCFSSDVQLASAQQRPIVNLRLASGEEILLSQNSNDTVFVSKTYEQVKLDSGRLIIYDGEDCNVQKQSLHVINVPEGNEYQLVLSDGTKVWMNSETSLKFPGKFIDGERKVELVGEAYFDVAEDSLHPFVISTSEIEIKVLGTSFNVKCYQKQPAITTLVTGIVEITNGDQEKIILKPGQQAIAYQNVITVKEVETLYYTAWKDGYFMFNDLPLKSIMQIISNWYNLDYEFSDSDIAEIHITARLKKYGEVDSVLKVLSIINEINISRKGNSLLIEPK